jgi:peptidoglycan-associated lipoprotein
LIFSLVWMVGCKKKPVTETSIVAPAPVAAAPQAAEVPEQVQKMVANFKRVYFDTDQSDLNSGSRSALTENVAIMQSQPDIRIELQGHADERGTTDYNLALGQRRAHSVFSHMKTTGISAQRLRVVSYGEERPATMGGSEAAWSQNRRCEFVITWGGDGGVEGTTGG